jgi:nucleoside-diphosphate-sugar epimerase
MRILITGATGFLGRPLVTHLAGPRYECTVLTGDVQRAATCGLSSGVALAATDAHCRTFDLAVKARDPQPSRACRSGSPGKVVLSGVSGADARF